MGRALTVEYTCDAAACGTVWFAPVIGLEPSHGNPPLPPDWEGTANVQFCPKHAYLVHAHRSYVAALMPKGVS